jgi:hypothetical protein
MRCNPAVAILFPQNCVRKAGFSAVMPQEIRNNDREKVNAGTLDVYRPY